MDNKPAIVLALGVLCGLAILITPSSSLLGQGDAAVDRTSWEYEVKSLRGNQYEYESELNEMGVEGWELVSASPNPNKFKEGHLLLVLKRQKR